jgi:glutamate racemase
MEQPSIGIFDSGVGGLSILREIRKLLPKQDILYFADQAHVPYGPRPMDEVRSFAEGISQFLIHKGSKVIVVACNTASAAALHHLRTTFPQVLFVGMEPAVKPAALSSRTQRVGVLATPTTFQGELFASVVERFAQGVEVIERTLPGLVEKIEQLDLDGPETRAIISEALLPLLDQGIDTLVLACTHYPFVVPLIQRIAGAGVQVIDPAPAIARQTKRVWNSLAFPQRDLETGDIVYYSTQNPERLAQVALQLINQKGSAIEAKWHGKSVSPK